MTNTVNPVSSEMLLQISSLLPSSESEKKAEEKKASSKAKMGTKLIAQGPAPKIISGSNKSADEAIMQALALIQELEILLILLHNKDMGNQSKIGKITEKQAINQQKLQASKLKQIHEIEHNMKKRAHIMKIVGAVLGAVAVLASVFMGPGAFLVSAAMFSLQMSGEMEKITAHMSPGLKAAFFVGMVAAGALTAGGIDAAAEGAMSAFASAGENAAEEGIEVASSSVATEVEQASTNAVKEETTEEVSQTFAQKYNSFVKGGLVASGQTSSVLQEPITQLLQKMGMSKHAADIFAEIMVMLIALVSMIAAAKANSPELTLKSAGKSFLNGKGEHVLFRASQGVTGGLMGYESYLGFLQGDSQMKKSELYKKMGPIDALLSILHEIMQKVELLVGFSSKVQGSLEKSFGMEMQALATLPLIWQGAARVTNSAA